jgi:hypothetical protein
VLDVGGRAGDRGAVKVHGDKATLRVGIAHGRS